MAMASTNSSLLQPMWFGYEVAGKEDDDLFFFSNHLPLLEFDGKGQTQLDWNNYLPFEQEITCWELAPPNPNINNNTNTMSSLSVDPLWSILDCQNNCPSPNFFQEGIGEIQAYCSTGPRPLEEMGPIEQSYRYSSVENCGDDGRAAVAVICNAEPVAKRPWHECGGGVGSPTSRAPSKKAISQYFYLPITQAAKELNIGLTLLKKRCRELGIRRWPHRKLMSLQTLIKNVQEMGGGSESCTGKTNVVVEILEQERRLLEEVPDVQLEEKTKRLRQACFKASYKKRKLMGTAGPFSGASCSTPSDLVFGYDAVFGCDAAGLGGMRW